MHNAIDEFRQDMMANGVTPPDHIEPGRILRTPGHQKSGSNKAAWCIMFEDMRGGVYGDYSTGMEGTWQASTSALYTPAERDAHRQRIKALQAQREADEAAKHAAGAADAAGIWKNATRCTGHEYTGCKGIEPHGARLIDADKARAINARLSLELSGPLLVIPMRDAGGKLHSLQFIAGDGTKRPVTGGNVKGCYHSIGGKPTDRLVIAEGFATAASIHEATGWPVAVAFNAGNVGPVAVALHEKYPDLTLILAADDDHLMLGNPGMTAAKQAALAVGGFVVAPQFPADRPPKTTDFNDLAALAGLGAVRACFSEIEVLSC